VGLHKALHMLGVPPQKCRGRVGLGGNVLQSLGSRIHLSWVWTQALPHTSYVTLGELSHFSLCLGSSCIIQGVDFQGFLWKWERLRLQLTLNKHIWVGCCHHLLTIAWSWEQWKKKKLSC
jgi:hypothetical protein